MPRAPKHAQDYQRRETEHWLTCPNPDCTYHVHPTDTPCEGCGEEEGGPVWVQQRPLRFSDEATISSHCILPTGSLDVFQMLTMVIDRTVHDATIPLDPDEWQHRDFGWYAVRWLGVEDLVDRLRDTDGGSEEEVEERKKKSNSSNSPQETRS